MGPKRKDTISISPMSGGVNHGDKQKCVLTFCPPCRTTLRDSELTLKVGSAKINCLEVQEPVVPSIINYKVRGMHEMNLLVLNN